MTNERSYAPLWLAVFYAFLLLFIIAWTGVALLGQIRDLQRRVGQLESERR